MSAHRKPELPRAGHGVRRQSLAVREQQLQETEEQFQEVARQWLTKERQIQELASLVQLKERQLQDGKSQIQLKDQQLRGNEQLLSTKEKLIDTKDQLLAARERQLSDHQTQLSDQQTQIEAKNQQVRELNRQLGVKQQHLDELLGSRALRIGSTLTWPARKFRHSRLFNSALSARGVNGVDDHISAQESVDDLVEALAPATTPARTVGTLVIGVVTYNNSEGQLARLSRSIEFAARCVEEAQIMFRLFVIDNGQESAWPESSIQSRRFNTQGNIGFGRGMNVLMNEAFGQEETEWFLCLNPDGVMHHRALKELLSSSVAHPDSLIEARQFPEEHVKPYDPQTLDTPWATGACLLIRRRIFESTGGFDPNFFMYLEDIDLSWRARSAGFSIKVSPKALFGHAVLHRKPDQTTDKSFLLSGRYLAFKWKNFEFHKWAERELVKRRYYQSRFELPELPEAVAAASGIKPEMSDFKHYFNFSKPRW